MSETLVKVECLGKRFCRSLKHSLWYGLQDIGREVIGRRRNDDSELRSDEFWAVRDVSFELRRGECFGLVGPNGAGKTTLLRMLNGLIKPDHGRIEMRGRVGGLIALGAGFNPILTGRENIHVNASVLGLSKREIDDKIDEIIDFAEIGEFIDAPVQNYSSGMQVRLGFSVAVATQPDILLLDEVLAVGDLRFRAKCHNRISEMMGNTAVIMVSHNMEDISRLCTRATLLSHGETVCYGSSADVIGRYIESCKDSKDSGALIVCGDYIDMKIVEIKTDFGETVEACGKIFVRSEIRAKNTLSDLGIVWFLLDSDGRNVCVSREFQLEFTKNKDFLLTTELSGLRLCPGIYRLGANIIRRSNEKNENKTTIYQKWRLMASFRDLGKVVWKTNELICFGSSVFMNSHSTLNETN